MSVISWLKGGAGIKAKVLSRFVALSVIPLVILGAIAVRQITMIADTAIEDSILALNKKSKEAIELRTIETAERIKEFLEERESDLRTLEMLPKNAENYRSFLISHVGEVWRKNDEGQEVILKLPLYSEVVYVDQNGMEQVKAIDGIVNTDASLENVRQEENTIFKAENYFENAKDLVDERKDGIFVSHVIGRYLTMDDVLLDAETVMNAEGKHYQGIVRFAKPVFDQQGNFNGVVALALNHTHLMEFTRHILPTEERYAVVTNPEEGNEAFMVDNEGWFISNNKEWMIRGVDKNGDLMPPATEGAHLKDRFLTHPVKLDALDFEEFPQFERIAGIPQKAGTPGSITDFWEGKARFVAYAPIKYFGGQYAPPMGFGWVGIGATIEEFFKDATKTADVIQRATKTTIITVAAIILISSVIVFVVAYTFAKNITRPIIRLTELADKISMGDLDLKIDVRSKDEIGALAESIGRLATSLQAAMKRLTRQRSRR
jgi:HAMP domain-containing protein